MKRPSNVIRDREAAIMWILHDHSIRLSNAINISIHIKPIIINNNISCINVVQFPSCYLGAVDSGEGGGGRGVSASLSLLMRVGGAGGERTMRVRMKDRKKRVQALERSQIQSVKLCNVNAMQFYPVGFLEAGPGPSLPPPHIKN